MQVFRGVLEGGRGNDALGWRPPSGRRCGRWQHIQISHVGSKSCLIRQYACGRQMVTIINLDNSSTRNVPENIDNYPRVCPCNIITESMGALSDRTQNISLYRNRRIHSSRAGSPGPLSLRNHGSNFATGRCSASTARYLNRQLHR